MELPKSWGRTLRYAASQSFVGLMKKRYTAPQIIRILPMTQRGCYNDKREKLVKII